MHYLWFVLWCLRDWCSVRFFMMLNLRFVFNLIPYQSFVFGLNLLMQLNDCFSHNCDPWSSILMLLVLFDCCQKAVKSPINLFHWASCDEPNSEFFLLAACWSFRHEEGRKFLTTWMLRFLFMIFGLHQFCLSSVFGPAQIMVKCLGQLLSEGYGFWL